MSKLAVTAVSYVLVLSACAMDGAPPVADPQASASATAAVAVTSPTSLVFDPGPKNRCFHTVREGITGPQTQFQDAIGCPAVDDPQRFDHGDACKDFPYKPDPKTGNGLCPAWDFITFGWDSSQFRAYPGYDTQIWGSSGSQLTLVLQNNTANLFKAGAPNCDLHEVAFAYDYPSSGIRRTPAAKYTMADGDVVVTYDAWAKQSGSFKCAEKRSILTADLIFFDVVPDGTPEGHSRKNVISVVNYDPGHFLGAHQVGDVIFHTDCVDGCRVTLLGQQIPAETTTTVSINFSDLVRKLQQENPAFVRGMTIDDKTLIYAIQFVNSGRGADLETRITKAHAELNPRS